MSFLKNITSVHQLETRTCRVPFWIHPVPLEAILGDLENRGFAIPAEQETVAVTWELDVRQPNSTYRMLEKKHKRGGVDGAIGRMTMTAAAAQLSGRESNASDFLGSLMDMEPEHWKSEPKRLFAAKTHLIVAGRLVVRLDLETEENEEMQELSKEDIAELLEHENIIPSNQVGDEAKAWEGEPIGLSLLLLVERWAKEQKQFMAQVAEEAAEEMGKASGGGKESGSPSTPGARGKSKKN